MLRVYCQGTKPSGRRCPNTLLEVEGAEVRLCHRGRRVVLRGMLVSGTVQCEECGATRYLVPEDFAPPPPAIAVVEGAVSPQEAA